MANILIQAGPGCAKTTSIVNAYNYRIAVIKDIWLKNANWTEQQVDLFKTVYDETKQYKSTPIYMAYNKNIVEDMKKKVHGDCKVLTLHGWGYQTIKDRFGYISINDQKDMILISQINGGRAIQDLPNKFDWISSSRYFDKLKDEQVDITFENFMMLRDKYDSLAAFKIHENMVDHCQKLFKASLDIDPRIGISYSDQIWLPLFLLDKPKYEWGFCDEAQDLSPAKLKLARKLCKDVIFCGDTNQAINGWTGADTQAMEKIEAVCEKKLYLTTSFRLPPNHADYANKIRPNGNIISMPGKADGRFERISEGDTVEWAKEFAEHKPMVLCRYNAPLINYGMKLLSEGIPVNLPGDTLKKQLIDTVKNRKASSMADLQVKLNSYKSLILRSGDEMAKQANEDKFKAIENILSECNSIDEYYTKVESLTRKRKDRNHVVLSTVHRAKGLEANVIGILNAPIPSTKAKTEEQKEQEINVNYVGHTRSKRDMFYL